MEDIGSKFLQNSAKLLFYTFKPLMDDRLNKKAKKYMKTLAKVTNTPEWATENVKMYFTFGAYSGINRNLMKKVKGWKGLMDYIKSGNPQEYEISAFPSVLGAPLSTHVAHDGSHAIRLNICARYDIYDPTEVREFVGKAGEIILGSMFPEVKPVPLEEHQESLRELEETLEKLKNIANLLRQEGHIDFERYKRFYEGVIYPAGLPSCDFVDPERLKKLGKEDEIEKYLATYLNSVLILTAEDIAEEKGRIAAMENEDEILNNLDGFYLQSPDEIRRKFLKDYEIYKINI